MKVLRTYTWEVTWSHSLINPEQKSYKRDQIILDERLKNTKYHRLPWLHHSVHQHNWMTFGTKNICYIDFGSFIFIKWLHWLYLKLTGIHVFTRGTSLITKPVEFLFGLLKQYFYWNYYCIHNTVVTRSATASDMVTWYSRVSNILAAKTLPAANGNLNM